MAMTLNDVVPWGRTAREYELMFALDDRAASLRLLDCGGGPASFNAEWFARGRRVVSVDPLYRFGKEQIRRRFDEVKENIISQVRNSREDWDWGLYESPEGLLEWRTSALEDFLADYPAGLRESRYLEGSLPTLPLEAGAFDLALCSHFLFLYSGVLDEDFHIASLRELCRVAQEVRIFPLLDLSGVSSPHVTPVRKRLEAEGCLTEILTVPYQFQRGGNQMLRVVRACPDSGR